MGGLCGFVQKSTAFHCPSSILPAWAGKDLNPERSRMESSAAFDLWNRFEQNCQRQ